MPRQLSSESHLARSAISAVLGHENRTSAGHPFQHPEQPTATGKLGVRGHLNGTAHPRQLSRFRDDRFIGIKNELQNGHGGAGDAALHKFLLLLVRAEWDCGSLQQAKAEIVPTMGPMPKLRH